MTKMALVFLLIISNQTYSSENFNLNSVVTTTTHSWNLNEAHRKFEDSSINSSDFLNYYTPAGVTVVKKVIDGNNFEFQVIKKILGFQKRFNLLGSVSFQTDRSENCKSGEESYTAHIDFSRSGPDITDTISDFFLHLCTFQNGTQFNIRSKNILYYKGSKFNSIYESIARNLVTDQVGSFYSSIKSASITVK